MHHAVWPEASLQGLCVDKDLDEKADVTLQHHVLVPVDTRHSPPMLPQINLQARQRCLQSRLAQTAASTGSAPCPFKTHSMREPMNPNEPSATTAGLSDAARRPIMPSNATPREVIDTLSDTAQSVVITERPYYDHSEGCPATEVLFTHPSGFNMGAKVASGSLIVMHLGSLQRNLQRKGYGTAVMQRAVKYAADRDLRFFNEASMTSAALQLVAAMARRGYVVRIDRTARWDPDREPQVEFWTTPKSFTEFEEDE